MSLGTITDLVDSLRESQVLSDKQMTMIVRELQSHFSDPKMLARELIQRGWLTPFQVNQIAGGRGRELVMGPYVLLERLGRGGMGQVYKARHQLMKRLVALKIIRSDRLATAALVARFRREIQAIARVSHPNIVIAYDAAQLGGKHFLVMEYVEGVNLGELVKTSGPLPVSQACDYIRQVALGLQHVYERGLVHRDIKPSNLLVTADGTIVKILDLGLARLYYESGETNDALTQTEDIMGTPDYIAPEQTRDFHRTDIRADIYSLGCTFYFLLTGKPPFPGGTVVDKFLKHREIDPLPLEMVRSQMPREVAKIWRKMVAKKPEHRYQTPAALAEALAPWCVAAHETPVVPSRNALPAPPVLAGPLESTTQLGETHGLRQKTTESYAGSTIGQMVLTALEQFSGRRKLALVLALGLVVGLAMSSLWIVAQLFFRANENRNVPTTQLLQRADADQKIPTELMRELVLDLTFEQKDTPPLRQENQPVRLGIEGGNYVIELLPGRDTEGYWKGYDASDVWDFAAELRCYVHGGDCFFKFRAVEDNYGKSDLNLTIRRNGSWLLRRVYDLTASSKKKEVELAGDRNPKALPFKEDQWNEVKIEAYDNLIEFQINGQTVIHCKDAFQRKPGTEAKAGLIFGTNAPKTEQALLKVDYLRMWRLTRSTD